MDSSDDGGDEAAPGSPGAGGESRSSMKPTARRDMKTPYQLEVLEQTYTEDPYPNEAKQVELSAKLGLTNTAAADVVLPPEAQGLHGTEPEKMELPHNPLCRRGECGDLRCTQFPILGPCSSRAGGAGGVCSSAPRATKRSCPSSSTSTLTHHGRSGEAMMLTLLERINPGHGTTFSHLQELQPESEEVRVYL